MTPRYCMDCGALPRGVGGSHGCPDGCPGRDPWAALVAELRRLEQLVLQAIHGPTPTPNVNGTDDD